MAALLSIFGGIVAGPFKKYLGYILVVAAVLGALWFGWNRYTNLVEDKTRLENQVVQLERVNQEVRRGQAAVEEVLQQSLDRVRDLETIKHETTQVPSGDVPPDIRHVLERLRERDARNQ